MRGLRRPHFLRKISPITNPQDDRVLSDGWNRRNATCHNAFVFLSSKFNNRHFDRSNSRSWRVAESRNLLLYLDRCSATMLVFALQLFLEQSTTSLRSAKGFTKRINSPVSQGASFSGGYPLDAFFARPSFAATFHFAKSISSTSRQPSEDVLNLIISSPHNFAPPASSLNRKR